jgi:hypothetical protein
MTHPEGTGYDFVPTESSQLLVEQRFMRIVDQKASETMEALLDGKDISALNLDQKSAWSRFVMSLVQRNPEKVAWITQVVDAHYDNRLARLEADYDSIRTPGYPFTFAEYRDRVAPKTREMLKAELLTTIVDSQKCRRNDQQDVVGCGDPNRSTTAVADLGSACGDDEGHRIPNIPHDVAHQSALYLYCCEYFFSPHATLHRNRRRNLIVSHHSHSSGSGAKVRIFY